jgi:hypothetical protein
MKKAPDRAVFTLRLWQKAAHALMLAILVFHAP